ncbi:cytochrome P450 [Nocardiopsis trehalosi]|uniref:cytochrome P450 n=1 Tax=Nocardiopsis trehalosi TaxID=109329 RepID=UPI00082F6E58|nr:cytochrome P450 [Nocardiopsis trehalosi]
MTANPALPSFPFPADHPLGVAADLRRIRDHGAPVRVRLPFGRPAWLVTRYDDVRRVLTAPEFGRDAHRAGVAPHEIPGVTPRDPAADSLLSLDPPDHSRLRRLVSRVFTPRRVEDLRPRAQALADRLVDRLLADGPPADLVEHFALPLPVGVVCDLLGVPAADRELFRGHTETLLSTDPGDPEAAARARTALDDYLAGLVARRAHTPTDDLIGALVRLRDSGDRLSDPELVSLVRTLLIAGHETTANLIPDFLVLLLAGDGYCELVADPERVPSAVEELLRLTPLITMGSFPRFALKDVEIGGVRVRAGEAVIVELSAANRDPGAFAFPETLDLLREENPHLAFGFGVHRCVGAALARVELQVALRTLVRRLPRLALAKHPDDLVWRDSVVRGPRELPVTW